MLGFQVDITAQADCTYTTAGSRLTHHHLTSHSLRYYSAEDFYLNRVNHITLKSVCLL